jgi:type II secretory pathway component PulM
MNSVFDRLNLRPQERRLVVIVGIVVFVVLNFVFVFPNFGAFGRLQQRTIDARKKLDLYNSEIGRQSLYQKEIITLQSQGASVATEGAQVATLADNVNSHAVLSGININGLTTQRGGSTTGKTNAWRRRPERKHSRVSPAAWARIPLASGSTPR